VKPINFEAFWKQEFGKCAEKYAHDPEFIVELRNIAKRAWEQAVFTNDNAERY
jgi:hypothetical protein